MTLVRSNQFNSREAIYEAAAWLRKRDGVRKAREYARFFAFHDTYRGRDFWFAVTEILGGDTTGWRS